MSVSPPIRRLSSSSKREEDLINAFEAEEERILHVLSRKLEKLREEKVQLENVLEAESELHVNRLTRELTTLRRAQQAAEGTGNGMESPELRPGFQALLTGTSAPGPSVDILLESLRQENENLRLRFTDMERDYVRVVRLNEIYREELLEHRRRLGLPVDNLVGLGGVPEPPPIHARRSSSYSLGPTLSPTYPIPIARMSSTIAVPTGVPIPRPSSRIHRPSQPSLPSPPTPISASASGPNSHSPSPLVSPLLQRTADAFASTGQSYASGGTELTTPASSASLHATPPDPIVTANGNSHILNAHGIAGGGRILSYPSVPPPSLSSSLGSPTVPVFFGATSPPSPVESRGMGNMHRGRERGAARIAETGSLRGGRPSMQNSGRTVNPDPSVSIAGPSREPAGRLPAMPEVFALSEDGGSPHAML